MFDFGFRPWGQVFNDVGGQVKEQINRYQEGKLREQLLMREDALRQQGIMRQDMLRNEDIQRQDAIRREGRQQQLADLERPTSDTVRDMLLRETGYEPQFDAVEKLTTSLEPVPQQWDSNDDIDWTKGERSNGMPSWMTPIPRPEEGVRQEFAPKETRVVEQRERPRPKVTQRDVNQYAQLAPVVRAAKYGTGGMTPQQRESDLQFKYWQEEQKNNRFAAGDATRKSEGSANRGVKLLTEAEKIELGYARLNELTRQFEADFGYRPTGEKLRALTAMAVADIGAEKAQTTGLPQLAGGPQQKAVVDERSAQADASRKLVMEEIAKSGGEPAPVQSSVKKSTTVKPRGAAKPPLPPDNKTPKVLSYTVNGKPQLKPWSAENEAKLQKAGIVFTIK